MEQNQLEQTVVAQQQRIRELESRETKGAIDAALGSALDSTGLPLATGAREQLRVLLGEQLAVVPDAQGMKTVLAPGGAALNDWVKAQLGGGYSHFVRSGARLHTPPAAATGDPGAGLGESLSALVVSQHHQAAAQSRQTQGPVGDPSKPFGLRPLR